jgi:hypothetical protein
MAHIFNLYSDDPSSEELRIDTSAGAVTDSGMGVAAAERSVRKASA